MCNEHFDRNSNVQVCSEGSSSSVSTIFGKLPKKEKALLIYCRSISEEGNQHHGRRMSIL